MNIQILVNDTNNNLLDKDKVKEVKFYCMIYPFWCYYVARFKTWWEHKTIIYYELSYDRMGKDDHEVKTYGFLFFFFSKIRKL